VCLDILARGELQVSDKERKADLGNLFRDVASVLVEKCVNPETERPYTLGMLERALRDIHFSADPKRSAKQQALEALPALQERFPIQRARMRLRLQAPAEHEAEILETLRSLDALIETVEAGAGGALSVTAQVEPGAFRPLHDFVLAATRKQGRVEVVSLAVSAEGGGAGDDFGVGPARPAHAAAAAAAPAEPAPEEDAPALEPAGSSKRIDDPVFGDAHSSSSSRRPAAAAAVAAAAAAASASRPAGGGVLYARGPIAGLPEEFEARRERFAELNALQGGWEVELRAKGETVDAAFFSPSGAKVGAYANARRMALAAHKAAG